MSDLQSQNFKENYQHLVLHLQINLKLNFKIPVQSNNRQLDFMCEQVDIAGRSVQSIMNLEYGIRREIAYNGPLPTIH